MSCLRGSSGKLPKTTLCSCWHSFAGCICWRGVFIHSCSHASFHCFTVFCPTDSTHIHAIGNTHIQCVFKLCVVKLVVRKYSVSLLLYLSLLSFFYHLSHLGSQHAHRRAQYICLLLKRVLGLTCTGTCVGVYHCVCNYVRSLAYYVDCARCVFCCPSTFSVSSWECADSGTHRRNRATRVRACCVCGGVFELERVGV